MGYWKSKVLPKIKKVFDKNGTKKAGAAEACKLFDDSKEEYNNAFEENKTELQTKVTEIYESSSTEVKSLVKEPNEAGLKKNSTAVQKFLEELVKIDFPGSKPVSEASSKFGPALVSGPVSFVFEKVSTFIVTEEKVEKVEEATPTTTTEETSGVKEREIVVEEGEKKKEEAEEKTESVDPPSSAAETVEEKPAETTTTQEVAKEEEKPAEAAETSSAEKTAEEQPKP
ncbi:Plasma membrane-associated cation-binding protein 1 [Stylosanthes scabra]|uniref:Plasma membrane-associated cation-binding protein 1 n=1 Tax=Stylosanthes scabra TaxID=79078 RepID=A0ABU6ZG96_9FABA|nr:Plasma membrane-associated cation-binding protein 1 [Stylosanthes scabra]